MTRDRYEDNIKMLIKNVHIPVAARFKSWVSGRSLAGIAGSNHAGGWVFVVSVVCCQMEASAAG